MSRRVYVRRFDWDEARRLRSEGMSYPKIADMFGVTPEAVRYACDDEARAKMNAYSTEWKRGGKCVDCGAQCTRNHARCASCRALAQASSVGRPIVADAYGGIQGRVQTLTNRGGLRFHLYDLLNDRSVSCYLEEGQEDIMRDVWGQLAVVEGWVHRDPVTGRPMSIRKVRNVSPVSEVATDRYREARGVVLIRDDERLPEELVSLARDD